MVTVTPHSSWNVVESQGLPAPAPLEQPFRNPKPSLRAAKNTLPTSLPGAFSTPGAFMQHRLNPGVFAGCRPSLPALRLRNLQSVRQDAPVPNHFSYCGASFLFPLVGAACSALSVLFRLTTFIKMHPKTLALQSGTNLLQVLRQKLLNTN